MRTPRGMTLIELLVAMTVMLIGVTAAMALMLAGSQSVRNAEATVTLQETARLAVSAIVKQARVAGFASPGGVYVKNGTSPLLANPVFGLDGTTGQGWVTAGTPPVNGGTDDLWLIVPQGNVLGKAGTDRYAATTLAAGAAASSDPLSVTNTGGFQTGDQLLVSNSVTSALLSVTGAITADSVSGGVHTAGGLSYAESGLSGFSPSPTKGFQANDMVFGAKLVHFYIGTANGKPAMFQETGAIGADAWGRPFVGATNQTAFIGVEDLQISYGFDSTLSGDPATYTYVQGLGPAFTPNLRTLQIAVVVRSETTRKDSNAKALTGADYAPPTVQNHTSAGVPDGFLRIVYNLRVELPNFSPGAI